MAALVGDVVPAVLGPPSWVTARPGPARAFSRTVRDVIDWSGQRRNFRERAHDVLELPPIAVFWGGKDTVVPATHADEIGEVLEEVTVTRFDACGHFPHFEEPDAFANALLGFMDAPEQARARFRAAS